MKLVYESENPFTGAISHRIEYETPVKYHDIVDYVRKQLKDKLKGTDKAIIHDIIVYTLATFDDVGAIDLEGLENDVDFVEFMHDRYEEEAYQDYEDSL